MPERDWTKTPVDGYGPGFFRIGGEVVLGHLALFASGPRSWAGLNDLQLWRDEDRALEVVIVGTGQQLEYLPAAFIEGAIQAGLRLEPMTTPSALKLYNILLSEGRRVGVIALAL